MSSSPVTLGSLSQIRDPKRLSHYQLMLAFLLVFTVPLRNVSLLEVPGANLRIGDLIILGGLAIAHASWLLRPSKGRWTRLDWSLVFFVMLCLVSITWSLDPVFGLARAFKYGRDLVFYFLLSSCVAQDVRRGYQCVAAGAALSMAYIVPVIVLSLRGSDLDLATLAAVQFASSAALDPLRSEAIAGSTFAGTINDLGRWANVGFFLLLGTGFWLARIRTLRWGGWLFLASLLTIQVVSFSRGAWMGLLIGGLWWVVILRGRIGLRLTARLGLLFTGCALALWVTSRGLDQLIVGRIQSSFQTQVDAAISERLVLWNMAVSAFSSRPLGGVGMGGGIVIAAATGVKDWYVHNVYLQIIFELGILGLLVWGYVLWKWLRTLFSVRCRSLAQRDRLIVVACQAAVISLLIAGLTGTDFTEQEYWILLALSACLQELQVTSSAQANARPQSLTAVL